MARQTSIAKHDKHDNCISNSPNGFWPIPGQESFHKEHSPPWEVPNRRKTRGHKDRPYYYDLMEENVMFTRGGEVTTENAFKFLEDTLENVEQEPSRKKILCLPEVGK